MKAVMISIRPKWIEKIAKGEKTIEVRKSKPNLEVPFKCYIYQTKGEKLNGGWDCAIVTKNNDMYYGGQKVIGEFSCDKIDEYNSNERGWYIYPQEETCLLCDEIAGYGKGKTLYGWHISELKIYDKPKELSEFWHYVKCNSCAVSGYESGACIYDENCLVPKAITRPFQSWGYINV